MTFDAITLGALIQTFDGITNIKVYDGIHVGAQKLNLKEIVTSLDRTVSSITTDIHNSTVYIRLNPLDKKEET